MKSEVVPRVLKCPPEIICKHYFRNGEVNILQEKIFVMESTFPLRETDLNSNPIMYLTCLPLVIVLDFFEFSFLSLVKENS